MKGSSDVRRRIIRWEDCSTMEADFGTVGWGGRIRTYVWQDQNPLPYHIATPQRIGCLILPG